MSASKYAGLPDIDTAQDVYETEDTFSDSHYNAEAGEDESSIPTRPSASAIRAKHLDGQREEVDSSHLMSAEEAGKRFRKAEKRNERQQRILYTYPPSPTSPTFPAQSRSISTRLRALQAEIESLEAELADPSNPLLHVDPDGNDIEPGQLIRGLVDVRGRLEKVRKEKEGHGRLIEVVMGQGKMKENEKDEEMEPGVLVSPPRPSAGHEEMKNENESLVVAEMDRRVGELEALVGSSSTTLDETSPLPAPLLPMLSRLNAQLSLLTQPRHLDSISRRLKLLLSDLDRVSTSHQQQSSKRQQSSHPPAQNGVSPSGPSALQEQLAPLLTRLAPNLPHIPHILMRLRTLSALHTSASDFQGTLQSLEEEQRRARSALEDLERAVESVEKSLEENGNVVKTNVGGLDQRVEALSARITAFGA